jgi:hypothetical protein
MVHMTQLIVPTLVSSAFVFILSTLIHVVFKWHNPDYRKLPNEDEVGAAIRKGGATPGQYIFPHGTEGGKQSPEMEAKFVQGPIGAMYLRKPGKIQMGPFLGSWFAYTIVIGLIAGYTAHVTLTTGAAYMTVFRVVGVAAWLGYAWQAPSDSIWKGKPWITTFKEMGDGLLYALLTAGTFGWLWPR